jgi:hypothetical protein
MVERKVESRICIMVILPRAEANRRLIEYIVQLVFSCLAECKETVCSPNESCESSLYLLHLLRCSDHSPL